MWETAILSWWVLAPVRNRLLGQIRQTLNLGKYVMVTTVGWLTQWSLPNPSLLVNFHSTGWKSFSLFCNRSQDCIKHIKHNESWVEFRWAKEQVLGRKCTFLIKGAEGVGQHQLFHSLTALKWDVMSRAIMAILKPRGMGEQDCSDSSLDVTEAPNQC